MAENVFIAERQCCSLRYTKDYKYIYNLRLHVLGVSVQRCTISHATLLAASLVTVWFSGI